MSTNFLKQGTEEHFIKEYHSDVPFIIRNHTRKTIVQAIYANYKRHGPAHGMSASELSYRLDKARTTLLDQLEFLEKHGVLISKKLPKERLWMLNIYAGKWLDQVLIALRKYYGIEL